MWERKDPCFTAGPDQYHPAKTSWDSHLDCWPPGMASCIPTFWHLIIVSLQYNLFGIFVSEIIALQKIHKSQGKNMQ
jgi:hypothetical protein